MNEERFQLFWLYNIELHNLHITNKLRIVANPFSKTREQYLVKPKINLLPQSNSELNVDVLANKMAETLSVKESKSQFKCSLCSKVYQRYGNLANHLKKDHDIENETFNCDQCLKPFSTIKQLNQHKKKSFVELYMFSRHTI